MKSNRRFMTTMSLVLCCVLLLSDLLAIEATAAEGDKTYGQFLSGETESENGCEEDYHILEIATEEELAEFAVNCRTDIWSADKYVKLTEDIVLTEHKSLMIPTFGGIFDGNGHKISGLAIESQGSSVGLFRYLRQGAVVRNLTVSGRVQPTGSQNQVGILAGVNYGRIQNCSVSGSVLGDELVGGIAGVNETSGEIRQCRSAAMVVGTHCSGGIAGVNRGVLNNCSNSGNINTYSKEVTYDLDDITIEKLEKINSMSNVAAHTDTGGIAGYSQGKIYYCVNTGNVGYQHVGYNTGGIVGRLHQGYLQNCTNSGAVYGRKDVGGIVGQMEPFLEIQYLNDKLDEIDRETEKLITLLDNAGEDMNRYGAQASDLSKNLSASLKTVTQSAGNLNSISTELWYIYNQELTGLSSDVKRLNQDLENQSGTDYTVSGGDWNNGENVTITVPDDAESYRAALRRFADSAGDRVDNLAKASSDRSGGITGNLETMDREMRAATDYLQQLTDVLEQGTDTADENTDAISAQAKVLRKSINELRDDLFEYEGITMEDTSDEGVGENEGIPGARQEESYYDTSAFQQGKITLCVNSGKVEADANVGGIAGQIATEYDFDPEDDLVLSGEESFRIEQTVKAVVRESQNLGEIIGKKDYVGGVVGKADFGAVISCESYGDVSSTGGSYVGGIVGGSRYAIRSCYYMGNLSGKNNVGGIAGKGSDIFYSYAYPMLKMTGECGGSIAGSLEEDGILWGNYYVEGTVAGVDAIGYVGGATPLEYQDFCSREGVPEAFAEFTVSFRAEGQELASFRCHYGEALEEAAFPVVPEKEGFYGRWPEFDYNFITGNRILEAEYVPWISTLASREQKDDRPLVLVQGQFLPETELTLEENGEEISISICDKDETGVVTKEYREPLTVRVYCENGANAEIEVWKKGGDTDTGIGTEGGYIRTESTAMGSYLEFSMEMPGRFRVTTVQDSGTIEVVIVIASAAAVLALVLFIVKCRKNRKRKNKKRKE